MKHVLNKKGVTILEGLIALLLLAMIAMGTFGVLLSSSRKSSTPDLREDMMYSMERAYHALQAFSPTLSSDFDPATNDNAFVNSKRTPASTIESIHMSNYTPAHPDDFWSALDNEDTNGFTGSTLCGPTTLQCQPNNISKVGMMSVLCDPSKSEFTYTVSAYKNLGEADSESTIHNMVAVYERVVDGGRALENNYTHALLRRIDFEFTCQGARL